MLGQLAQLRLALLQRRRLLHTASYQSATQAPNRRPSAAGMRITSMQVYTTGAEEFELPDPQPGHWRTLSACDAEGAAEGAAAAPGQPAAAPPAGVVVMQDRTTGMRLLTGMAGHSVTMKPATFEGGETGLSLYPHNSYVLIDMVPRDPSRACSFCAEAGVRLQKCAACRAARYW